MGQIIWKVSNFDEGLTNESNATLKFQKYGVNIHCSSIWSHWILFTLIKLMKDAIKISSSLIEFLIQIQRKESYLVTLSCSCTWQSLANDIFRPNRMIALEMWCDSHVNLGWLIMVRITSYINLSHSPKMKLVKVLRRFLTKFT
jgi:hypothetical protein